MATCYLKLLFAAFLVVQVAADAGLDPVFTYEKMTEVLANKEVLTATFKCVMKEGPCPDGTESLLVAMPAAYRSACEVCNDREKKIFHDGCLKIYTSEPELFSTMLNKLDPERKFLENFLEFCQSE